MSVLITGASRGIGEAIAKELAAEGRSLVLVARSGADLARVKGFLHTHVKTFATDLAEEAGRAALEAWIAAEGIKLTGLVNNAGIGTFGHFDDIGAAADTRVIRLNVEALTHLAHMASCRMRGVPGAFIMNIGSMAGFQGVPYFTTYAATKAYVLSFTEALARELRPHGIHVMCVCPGITKTGFQAAANIQHQEAAGSFLTSEEVARAAIRGLKRRRTIVIPGMGRALMVRLGGMLPRWVSVLFGERMMRKVLLAQSKP